MFHLVRQRWWLWCLEHGTANMSVRAAARLRQTSHQSATLGLIDLMKRSRPARATVAEVLGHRGDKRAIPVLWEALDDRDSHVRSAAALSLANLNAHSALRELETAWRYEKDVLAKQDMFKALIRLQWKPTDLNLQAEVLTRAERWGELIVFILCNPLVRVTLPSPTRNPEAFALLQSILAAQGMELLDLLHRKRENVPLERVLVTALRQSIPDDDYVGRRLERTERRVRQEVQDAAGAALIEHVYPAGPPVIDLVRSNEIKLVSLGCALLAKIGDRTAIPILTSMAQKSTEIAPAAYFALLGIIKRIPDQATMQDLQELSRLEVNYVLRWSALERMQGWSDLAKTVDTSELRRLAREEQSRREPR